MPWPCDGGAPGALAFVGSLSSSIWACTVRGQLSFPAHSEFNLSLPCSSWCRPADLGWPQGVAQPVPGPQIHCYNCRVTGTLGEWASSLSRLSLLTGTPMSPPATCRMPSLPAITHPSTSNPHSPQVSTHSPSLSYFMEETEPSEMRSALKVSCLLPPLSEETSPPPVVSCTPSLSLLHLCCLCPSAHADSTMLASADFTLTFFSTSPRKGLQHLRLPSLLRPLGFPQLLAAASQRLQDTHLTPQLSTPLGSASTPPGLPRPHGTQNVMFLCFFSFPNPSRPCVYLHMYLFIYLFMIYLLTPLL
ncbi:uncharacterized protein LOC108295694 [Cebus imitator]|uniref:uncharacterized protein LOC108295694 n=1 Tax=Cebus imitator TaxID=2715852 RepID=UPI000809A8AE|nr:uncharacterized protein LOC108295694 [Cebus imitator]